MNISTRIEGLCDGIEANNVISGGAQLTGTVLMCEVDRVRFRDRPQISAHFKDERTRRGSNDMHSAISARALGLKASGTLACD